MTRLFVAIDLPEAIKARLKPLCADLPGAKWVSHSQMHLTLRFIGEADASQQDAIQAGLATVRAAPFRAMLKGVGQFPPRGKPRVLWVGMHGDMALTSLQRQIEAVITQVGFEAEDHPFSPHITLARFKSPPSIEPIQQYFTHHQAFKTEAFDVDRFILFSSQLTPTGPIYRPDGVFPLT